MTMYIGMGDTQGQDKDPLENEAKIGLKTTMTRSDWLWLTNFDARTTGGVDSHLFSYPNLFLLTFFKKICNVKKWYQRDEACEWSEEG